MHHTNRSTVTAARSNILDIYGPSVLLATLMIAQIWSAGFYDDDSVISLWNQKLEIWGHTLWDYCYENFVNFLKFQGRFPLVFSFGLLPILLEIGNDLVAYRIYFGIIYLLSFLLIQSGLTRLFSSHIPASLVLIIFVSCSQFQNYHDSFTSYFAYLPLLTGFMVQAISSYDQLLVHINETSTFPRRLVIKHLAWVFLAILTWEAAIVVAVATLGQNLLSSTPFKRKWTLLLIPIGWGILFGVLNLLLKQSSLNTGTTIQVSSLQSILHAYLVQLASTIPVFVGDSMTPSVWRQIPTITPSAITGGVAVVCLLIWLTRSASTKIQKLPFHRWMVPVVGGVCFITVPPVLTAITVKYQLELKWGMGYLQLYVQTFGLALILGTLLNWLRGQRNKSLLALYGLGCVAIVILFAGNVSRNNAVVQIRNAFWKTPRDVTALALQQWDRSGEISDIVVERDYLQRWENSEFSQLHLGMSIPFHPRNVSLPSFPTRNWFLLASPTYQTDDLPAFAYFGRLRSANCTVDNTIVVERPPNGAPNVWLEYMILKENAEIESFSHSVPANKSGENVPVILREPRQIKRGTIKLSVRI